MGAILKRELIGFFKNPSGYFILAIYALLSALFFNLFVILNSTSYMGGYFCIWLTLVSMIVVSVLSMRFFSEEKKHKTDQLILTSPLGLNALVLGKFFGGMIVYTAATLLNLIYVVIIDWFGKADYGLVCANLLGTLLLGACLISIALFVSSLTESSIGAAAGTFAVFFLMMMADFVAVFLPSGIRTVVARLNIFLEYTNFMNGEISLASVIYYLSLTALFLFLSVRIIERRRWR